jgi:hypothetical protein
MAIVDRMANISPTYLFAIAQVRTSGHLVHRVWALSCAEDPGSHDVLVWKHLDVVVFRSEEPLLSKDLHCQQWISGNRGGNESERLD